MADIAINPVVRRVQFTGNTGLGPFAFTFNILQNTDIIVYKNTTLLTLTTDYTVTINANGTGSVTLTGSGSGTALITTDNLTIIGGRELSRTTDFVTAGDLLASSLNEQLDSNVIMSQQLDERFSRTISVSPGDADKTLTLPTVDDRKDKILKFDTEGNVEAAAASTVFANTVVGANFVNDVFTGTGAQTAFTLSTAPGSKNNCQIYIDGVYQEKSTFSINASTLTFTEAPPLNASIEVIIGNALDSFASDANAVNYDQGGTGYVSRTVESKLQEFVSVKDFGATGDGVTDDTAAFTAANAVGPFLVPEGTYKIGSNVTIASHMWFLSGGVLLVDSGITVTLEGTISASPYDVIFAGQGDCTFANSNTDNRIYANWYAANGTSAAANADFAARWNEMWSNSGLTTWVGMVGSQTVAQSMNCTGWNNADIGVRTVEADGSPIYIEHTDDVVFDTTDTSRAIFRNFTFKSQSAAYENKVCVLRARKDDDKGIGPCYFEHMDLSGYYSVATLVSSSAERQTFFKCIFANTYQDISDSSRPARILTAEPVGSFSIVSDFKTVSTTSILSGNGQHFIDCSAQCNADVIGTLPTSGSNKGATTIIKYDGGHIFENDYQRSGDWAAYLIDCTGGDAHNNQFTNVWVEPFNAQNQYYTFLAIGDGTSTSTVSDLVIDGFSDTPQTTSCYIKNVGRIWGLDFKGPFRSEANNNHGIVIESTGAVDMHSAVMKLGFAGDIDLSGINDVNSDLAFVAHVRNMSDYVEPTSGRVSATIYSALNGIKQISRDNGFADGDATPSVADGSRFYTANTSATTITDFDDGYNGQEIVVLIDDANTTIDFSGTNLRGNNGVDYTASQYDALRCTYIGTRWFCSVIEG